MKLGETQEFVSPEEALSNREILHYGVKGMRWGVRKEDDTGGVDAVERNDALKTALAKDIAKPSTGRVTSAPSSDFVTPTTKGLYKAPPKPVLSSRQQKRAEKFLQRADVLDTKISDIKASNEALKGSRNPVDNYNRYANNQTLKSLDKTQKRALKDAEASQKGKLTSTQKKLIVGAIGVSAILAAGAVYKGQQSGALNSFALLGSARLRGQKVPFNVNEKLTGPMSAHDLLHKVAKPVNPGYSKAGGKMNCRRSTYAYELRRRGFDVHATTSSAGWGQSESGVINAVTPGGRNFYRSRSLSAAIVETGASTVASGDKRVSPLKKIVVDNLTNYSKEDGKAELATVLSNIKRGKDVFTGVPHVSISASHKVLEELAKQPNGARGEVMFKFPSFGHSMAYEVVDGVPHIFDSQKGTLYNSATKMVESKWDGFTAAEITRLDNVKLDLNFLTRWADNND